MSLIPKQLKYKKHKTHLYPKFFLKKKIHLEYQVVSR
jgi:hypothetical protein